jgi:hypothetical protein
MNWEHQIVDPRPTYRVPHTLCAGKFVTLPTALYS